MELQNITPRDGWTLGIDASVFQGDIDFKNLPSNVGFGFFRATSGVKPDSKFERNATHCPFPWGPYHALAYGSDAKAQARKFISVVRPYLASALLPLVLDYEVERKGDKVSVSVGRAVDFLNEAEQLAGQKLMVYSYPDFISYRVGLGGDFSLLGQRDLWIAHYGAKEPRKSPSVPLPWKRWAFWQFAGGRNRAHPEYWHATLPNGTDVDVNWFCGSRERLDQLATYGEHA